MRWCYWTGAHAHLLQLCLSISCEVECKFSLFSSWIHRPSLWFVSLLIKMNFGREFIVCIQHRLPCSVSFGASSEVVVFRFERRTSVYWFHYGSNSLWHANEVLNWGLALNEMKYVALDLNSNTTSEDGPTTSGKKWILLNLYAKLPMENHRRRTLDKVSLWVKKELSIVLSLPGQPQLH